MSSNKASDTRLLDKILGIDPRAFDDDDATVVIERDGTSDDPTPPPVTDPTPSSAELPATEPVDVSSGVVIDGRYRVQRLIGRGGIGLVYLCHHEVLEKPVAMKVLRPEYAEQPEVLQRFVNEARAASAIKSPHTVNTLDVGSLPSGAPYFIMEYVDAETLAARLQREHALPLADAVEVARQMADGLAAAHGAGIVHRDLKPENVFVGTEPDGSLLVKIFDFGVAKVTRAKARLTHVGAIFGTPSYMSPEQARGQPVDPRTDVYAIGIMLFEMIAGHLPFDGDDPLTVMSQHVDAEIPPLKQTQAGAEVPSALENVVRRCLQKDREDRYASVVELERELGRVAATAEAHAAEPPAEFVRDSMLPEIVVPLDEVSSSGRAAPPPVASAPSASAPSAPSASAPSASAHSRPGQPAPSAPSMSPPLAAVRPVASTPAFVASPALAHSLAPAPASRRGFFPLLAAAVVIVAAGIWLALPSRGGVLGTFASPEDSALTPTTAPSADSALAPREHEVHLVLSPLDAQVYLGEKNLGPMPVSVKVEEGKPLVVSVRRKGYKPRRVVLDGSQTRIVVGLNKLSASGK
jgi:eukaryotic-like serine/threonine-protein kinase